MTVRTDLEHWASFCFHLVQQKADKGGKFDLQRYISLLQFKVMQLKDARPVVDNITTVCAEVLIFRGGEATLDCCQCCRFFSDNL